VSAKIGSIFQFHPNLQLQSSVQARRFEAARQKQGKLKQAKTFMSFEH